MVWIPGRLELCAARSILPAIFIGRERTRMDLGKAASTMDKQVVEKVDETDVSLGQEKLSVRDAYATPAVDIYETPKQLVLLVDVPGVEPENVEIDLKHNSISILAKVSEQERGRVLLDEYRAADFFRAFGITELVDYAGVQASLEDGVLKIVLPKSQRLASRKIMVSCD